MSPFSPPKSILIIGSGVFGLSTAHALALRHAFDDTTITVVDRSTDPELFPSRDASSIDTSRIIRADYSDITYAGLAAEAQVQWRSQHAQDLGGEGRYTESGLVLVADEPLSSPPVAVIPPTKQSGMDYVKSSWANVANLAQADPELSNKIRILPNPTAIRDAIGTGANSGTWGYINRLSGWADADASMRWLHKRVLQTKRVLFVSGTVTSLQHHGTRITGASLADGTVLHADLVVLAAGAWSGGLVDLAGQAVATGQVLGYMNISEEGQAQLSQMPVVLNLTTGLFVIPPAHGVLKVARHAYGYLNPTTTLRPLPLRPPQCNSTSNTSNTTNPTVSIPTTHITDPTLQLPAEGLQALRSALREMVPIPSLHDRPFSHTRLCWYSDTPTGDFLIDYHPHWEGLFLALGCSGHGFKFLPVIGEKIVDSLSGLCLEELQEKWAWKKTNSTVPEWDSLCTEDGSRGGKPGLILSEEMAKGSRI